MGDDDGDGILDVDEGETAADDEEEPVPEPAGEIETPALPTIAPEPLEPAEVDEPVIVPEVNVPLGPEITMGDDDKDDDEDVNVADIGASTGKDGAGSLRAEGFFVAVVASFLALLV